METVITRVQKALQKEFAPREIRLEAAGRGKLNGWIISKSFEDLTEVERYQKVLKLFDAYLSAKDRNRIVGFFTFTPLEEKMIFDENFDVLAAPAREKASSVRKKTMTAGRKNGRMKFRVRPN